MRDERFTTEYKKSVEQVVLPADYKEQIISNLSALDKRDNIIRLHKHGTNRKPYKLFASLVAASLVILLSVGTVIYIYTRFPNSQELTLNVYSATNRASISGARVVFRSSNGELLKDKKGETVTALTDQNGVATATVPATEEYVAEICAEGYIPLTETAKNGNYYVSPVMSEDTYRAVLTWQEGYDLDAFLSLTSKGKTEKLYYFNSDITHQDGTVIATLDVDNETGDGPETVTFNAVEGATFRFSAGSYSSLKQIDTLHISETCARVTLYQGEDCVGVYDLSSGSEGNVWCVFEIVNGRLQVCDETYSVSAITDIY